MADVNETEQASDKLKCIFLYQHTKRLKFPK